ncbi:MAG TPA: inositol monophosphatase family protein [Verrucomicrobiae bacterium]|nr:inositol monophosphatase family protein [Verrucomicrobiae bacterium]
MNLIAAQNAAVKAARAAGKIMRQHWLKPKRVKLADLHDIKLELDVRCQKTIEKILRAAFPGCAILGEEGISGDIQADDRWVVDPIDGTVNYFFGMPHAAVSIALQARNPRRRAGEEDYLTQVGVIFDPFTDELWTVRRGGPTRLNGRVVRVSDRSRVNDALVAMGFSKTRENLEKSLPYLNRLARQAKKVRIMGSAALELAYVASGRLDIYIERRINLWDIAAGGLMVECAGGDFYAVPVKGQFRYAMAADNGRLRRRLNLGRLLE